jgi:HEPN domain-containing protein
MPSDICPLSALVLLSLRKTKVSDRSADWLAQAERGLEHARRDVDGRFFEHSCFGAQQAAEKAVTAVYLSRKAEGWGHRAGMLLEELAGIGVSAPVSLVDDAKLLAPYYVPARYPNGFASGAPENFFTEEQARDSRLRQVGLFGSYATGTYGPGSDLDILLIVESSPERTWFLGSSGVDVSGPSVGADVFVYTEDEAWEMERESPWFRHVLSEMIRL